MEIDPMFTDIIVSSLGSPSLQRTTHQTLVRFLDEPILFFNLILNLNDTNSF